MLTLQVSTYMLRKESRLTPLFLYVSALFPILIYLVGRPVGRKFECADFQHFCHITSEANESYYIR